MKAFLKYALLVFMTIGLSGCMPPSKMVREGVIYKTRVYVGKYEKSVPFGEKFYNIQTSLYIFTLKENPVIPEGTFCYMRVERCKWDMHPDIAIELSPKYFTWNGAEKEYSIYNDVKALLK